MIATFKPLADTFELPIFRLPRLFAIRIRRKHATIDLIHSSPHLLRDIGAIENHFSERGR